MRIDSVRWMVSFWHPDGGSKTEPDFPQVDFWHVDRESSMAEAARVLIELREEHEDERDWVAVRSPRSVRSRVPAVIQAASGPSVTAT